MSKINEKWHKAEDVTYEYGRQEGPTSDKTVKPAFADDVEVTEDDKKNGPGVYKEGKPHPTDDGEGDVNHGPGVNHGK